MFNFDSDLSDGIVLASTSLPCYLLLCLAIHHNLYLVACLLAALLRAHVPSLQSTQKLRHDPISYTHRLGNARQVVSGLREIGLNHPITEQEIAQPVAR